ncbi:MAG: hypothetical protein FLDDKLPJ_02922 [Phycisphaerae bacterium]|nr:hypothetical protein [Phycisphaerae bacterium]
MKADARIIRQGGRRLRSGAVVAALAGAAAVLGVAAADPAPSPAPTWVQESAAPADPGAAGEVARVLRNQEEAWNRGDVEGFMRGYWNSPNLTFSSGGRVTRGWKETLDGFKTRYPDRTAMGRLTFDNLEVTVLGPDAALVLGAWRLDREKPVGGAFSLVFRKTGGAWVIIHDHTSVKDE